MQPRDLESGFSPPASKQMATVPCSKPFSERRKSGCHQDCFRQGESPRNPNEGVERLVSALKSGQPAFEATLCLAKMLDDFSNFLALPLPPLHTILSLPFLSSKHRFKEDASLLNSAAVTVLSVPTQFLPLPIAGWLNPKGPAPNDCLEAEAWLCGDPAGKALGIQQRCALNPPLPHELSHRCGTVGFARKAA